MLCCASEQVKSALDEKLPDPKASDFVDSAGYESPETEEEITVCKIWASILGLSGASFLGCQLSLVSARQFVKQVW